MPQRQRWISTGTHQIRLLENRWEQRRLKTYSCDNSVKWLRCKSWGLNQINENPKLNWGEGALLISEFLMSWTFDFLCPWSFAILLLLWVPLKTPESSFCFLFMTLFFFEKLSKTALSKMVLGKTVSSFSTNILYISSGWTASPILSRTPMKRWHAIAQNKK